MTKNPKIKKEEIEIIEMILATDEKLLQIELILKYILGETRYENLSKHLRQIHHTQTGW